MALHLYNSGKAYDGLVLVMGPQCMCKENNCAPLQQYSSVLFHQPKLAEVGIEILFFVLYN